MCLQGYIFCLSLRSQGLNTPMALSLIGADSTMLSLIISESSFYKTGDFFPSFAPNIGCGENIYNLSYYGLYSPIILFFLSSALCENVHLYTDSIHNRHYSKPVDILYMDASEIHRQHSVCTELCVSLFSALIFHSHRHIMFVNYMPFLLFRFYGYRGLF